MYLFNWVAVGLVAGFIVGFAIISIKKDRKVLDEKERKEKEERKEA